MPESINYGFKREAVNKAPIVSTVSSRPKANEAWCAVSAETVGGELDRDTKVEEVETVPPGRIAVRHSVRWDSFHGQKH